jgi:hypothetical protein
MNKFLHVVIEKRLPILFVEIQYHSIFSNTINYITSQMSEKSLFNFIFSFYFLKAEKNETA